MYDSSESTEEEDNEEDQELTKHIATYAVGEVESSKHTVLSAVSTTTAGVSHRKDLPTASSATLSSYSGSHNELHMVHSTEPTPVTNLLSKSSSEAQSSTIFVSDMSVVTSISTANALSESSLNSGTYVDNGEVEDDEESLELSIEKKLAKASILLVEGPATDHAVNTRKIITNLPFINIASTFVHNL